MTRRISALAVTLALLTSAPAWAADLIRVAASLPNVTSDMPFHAAIKLGYYKEANLDVQVTDYRGGQAAQEALTAGAADAIDYFAPGIALAVSKGAKQKVVAMMQDKADGFYLLSSSKSNIKSLKELDGKKIGVSGKGATSDYLALWAIDHGGIKAQVVPLGAGTPLGLRSGQVDAIALSGSMAVDLVNSKDAHLLVDFGKEAGQIGADTLAVSDDFIKNHPEQLRAFLAATFKAMAYMKSHRDWSVAFLQDKEKIDKASAENTYDVLMTLPDKGQIDQKTFKESLDFAARAWAQPELQNVDVAAMCDASFLPK